VQDHIQYTHDWVKGELSDPKFRSKTVILKTDYKRQQKPLAKIYYETMEEDEDENIFY
jgi:hypothetical protein